MVAQAQDNVHGHAENKVAQSTAPHRAPRIQGQHNVHPIILISGMATVTRTMVVGGEQKDIECCAKCQSILEDGKCYCGAVGVFSFFVNPRNQT